MYSLKKLVREIMEKIGSVTMGTSATTITGAIAEHETDISNLNSNFANFGTAMYYNNTKITFTLREHTIGDTAVIFNANQKVVYLLRLGDTLDVTVLHGNHTATLAKTVNSDSSVTYTLTDSGTLWGCNLLMVTAKLL